MQKLPESDRNYPVLEYFCVTIFFFIRTEKHENIFFFFFFFFFFLIFEVGNLNENQNPFCNMTFVKIDGKTYCKRSFL